MESLSKLAVSLLFDSNYAPPSWYPIYPKLSLSLLRKHSIHLISNPISPSPALHPKKMKTMTTLLTFLAITLSSLISNSVVKARTNLTGTWSSGSGAVLTGSVSLFSSLSLLLCLSLVYREKFSFYHDQYHHLDLMVVEWHDFTSSKSLALHFYGYLVGVTVTPSISLFSLSLEEVQ